ncbi:DUF2877 domain-containing protein [Neisseria sp. Ec49-e6-T10]|uniref:DUF2877 domain-containing protein n=1 Tax=Neisseria sp. Ec49-e6-T10 TaxID=3140744 RepID=UPI003EBE1748
MLCFRPLAVSQHLELTDFNTIKLVVQARFAHGLVVEIQEMPNSKTIFISDRTKGLLPEQIILSEHDFEQAFHQNYFLIELSKVKQFSLKASLIPPSYQLLAQKMSVLSDFLNQQKILGLGEMKCLINDPIIKTALTQPEHNASNALGWEDAVKWLIGRGPGSTPSGDDMLIGAMCVQYIRLQHVSALWCYFHLHRETYAILTTPLSIAYFDCAIQGLFSSRLLQVVKSLFLPTPVTSLLRYLENMTQVGAHSGIDGLFGVYMALQTDSKEIK